MAPGVQSLNLSVVRPLVRHVKRGSNGTAVWIFAVIREDLFIYMPIDIIDRVIEGNHYYLWDLFRC
jgi:hypothetical protein